jgi:membrane AbrB-like protein
VTPPPGAQSLSLLQLLLAQAAVLAVAFAGGWAAAASGAPAGWMSGAMIGVTAFAATGLAKPFLAPLRDFVIVLAGVSMGSGASPHALSALTHYPISLVMMTLALAAMTGSSYAVLVRSPGFSRQTALFAAIPGALSYVFVAAQGTGADMPRVAVAQVFRIFVLMAIVPLMAGRLGPAAPLIVPHDPALMTLALVAASFAVAYGLNPAQFKRRAALCGDRRLGPGAWVRTSARATGACGPDRGSGAGRRLGWHALHRLRLASAAQTHPRRLGCLRRGARLGDRIRRGDGGDHQGFVRPGARRLRAGRPRGDDNDGLRPRARSSLCRRPSPGPVFPHQSDAAFAGEGGSRQCAAGSRTRRELQAL